MICFLNVEKGWIMIVVVTQYLGIYFITYTIFPNKTVERTAKKSFNQMYNQFYQTLEDFKAENYFKIRGTNGEFVNGTDSDPL